MTICVDLGTTTTLVAISEGDRSPELLRIGELDAWMPSVVTWLDDATVVVGEEAERLEGAGILTWRAAKLDLTHKPDKCRRLQTGRWVSGWEAMRHLLAEALRRCVDQVQMDSQQLRNHKLTLACSAHAGSRYREGLVRVARELGFGGTSLSAIHDEPSAAALTLARYDRLIANTGAARQVLIYDFGGGTFDAAVVRVKPRPTGQATIEVLASGGAPGVGGEAIDDRVLTHLFRATAEANGCEAAELAEQVLGDAALAAHWRRTARRTKIALSVSHSETLTGIDLRLGELGLDEWTEFTFGRRELEALIRDLIEESMRTVASVLRSAYLGQLLLAECGEDTPTLALASMLRDAVEAGSLQLAQQVNVLLVGGTCAIPSVRNAVEDLFGGRVLPPTVIEPVQAVALGLADWDSPENSSPAHIGSLERRTLQIVAQDQTGEDLMSIEVLPPYDRTVLTAEQLLFFMLVRALRWAWHSDERLRWVLYREAPSILRDTTPVGQMLLDTRADGAMADVAAADRMSGSQLRQTVNDQLTNLARRAFLQQRLHGIDGAASGYDLSRLVQVWIDAHRNIMYEIEVGDPVSLNGSYRERTTRTFGTPTVGGTADTGRRRVVDLRDGVEREINHGGRRMPQSTAFGVATMDIGNPEWDPVPEAPESTDRYVARWTTLTGDLVEEFALPGSMDLASVRSSSDFLLGVDINGTHYPSEGALRGADWQGQYFRAVIALEQKMLSVGQRYSELVQLGRDRLRKLQKDAEPKYEDWREANP